MKRGEVWKPVVVAGGKASVENERIRRELLHASPAKLKAVPSLDSALGREDGLPASLARLNAALVEFYFIHPARAYRRLLATWE